MQPRGIHHVSVNVSSVSESVGFYSGVLGGTVRDDRPDFGFGGAWIDLGSQQVHLIESPTPENLGQHFAIEVADLDGAVGELRAKGFDVGDPSPVGSARQAFVTDPSGNLLELHEVGSSG